MRTYNGVRLALLILVSGLTLTGAAFWQARSSENAAKSEAEFFWEQRREYETSLSAADDEFYLREIREVQRNATEWSSTATDRLQFGLLATLVLAAVATLLPWALRDNSRRGLPRTSENERPLDSRKAVLWTASLIVGIPAVLWIGGSGKLTQEVVDAIGTSFFLALYLFVIHLAVRAWRRKSRNALKDSPTSEMEKSDAAD